LLIFFEAHVLLFFFGCHKEIQVYKQDIIWVCVQQYGLFIFCQVSVLQCCMWIIFVLFLKEFFKAGQFFLIITLL